MNVSDSHIIAVALQETDGLHLYTIDVVNERMSTSRWQINGKGQVGGRPGIEI